MTDEQKTQVRVLAAIGLVTAVGGAWLGYTLAQKHKMGGLVVGVLLAPAVAMPLGLLVAPGSLEPVRSKP